MTYNVFGGTLNPTLLLLLFSKITILMIHMLPFNVTQRPFKDRQFVISLRADLRHIF